MGTGWRHASRRTPPPGSDRDSSTNDGRQFQTPDSPPHSNRTSSHCQRPKPCVSRGRRSSQRQPGDRPRLTQTTPNNSEIPRQIIIKATLEWMRPMSLAFAASARVLKKRAAQSHLSMRTVERTAVEVVSTSPFSYILMVAYRFGESLPRTYGVE